MLRFYLNRAPVVALMCASALGCADPTQDFDDFRGRIASTTDAAPAPDTRDSAPEVARDGSIFDDAGVEAYSGTFWGTCLEGTYAGDLSKVTYDLFVFNLATDATGNVSLSGIRHGLRTDATNVSQVAGAVVTLPSSPVNSDGSFVTKIATFISPKEANGFGLELTVENGQYAFGYQTPGTGCGHFTGTVTSPLVNPIDEVCIFGRTAADGSFARITDPAVLRCP
ncbi:MAG: hypothetical protein ABI175_07640 [Polyangiales bacterium]